MSGQAKSQFVGRAGQKLAAALDAFGVSAAGSVCADFGCNVGGFTDCLVQRGAARVYAVDTGYGMLAWPLRKCARVVVMERTNALYCDVPEPVDLVVIDVAWTPQERIVPAAARWLKAPAGRSPGGRIISLLKPHYELAKVQGSPPSSPLTDRQAGGVCRRVCENLAAGGHIVRGVVRSALRGKGGNAEYFLLLGGPAWPGEGASEGERPVDAPPACH